MNDPDLLLEKEKVFDEYREIVKDIKESKALAKKTSTKIRKLEKDRKTIQKLIEIMIKYNCDPVEAKLKYGDKLKAKNSKYTDDEDYDDEDKETDDDFNLGNL